MNLMLKMVEEERCQVCGKKVGKKAIYNDADDAFCSNECFYTDSGEDEYDYD